MSNSIKKVDSGNSNSENRDSEKDNIVIFPMEFQNEGELPLRFSYEDANLTPEFEISNVPEDATTLAIIMEDTDAAGGNITNWIVYNIDPKRDKIGGDKSFGTLGKNSWTMPNYQGAIPISGRHVYRFTIYALKEELEIEEGYESNELRDLIKNKSFQSGFVEAFAEKTGYFSLA